MKIFSAAILLVVASSLLTFSAIAFILNPDINLMSNLLGGAKDNQVLLLLDAIALAGLIFGGMGTRQLYRINQRLAAG